MDVAIFGSSEKALCKRFCMHVYIYIHVCVVCLVCMFIDMYSVLHIYVCFIYFSNNRCLRVLIFLTNYIDVTQLYYTHIYIYICIYIAWGVL